MVLFILCDRLACTETRVLSSCVLSSWDPRARWTGGNASSNREFMSQRTVSFNWPNACYCSWPVSENQISPIRTVSLKMTHTVLNPTAETNLAFTYHFLRILFMALGVCKRCAELQNFPLRILFIAHQAWRIRSNGAKQIQTAMNFSTTRGRMVSIPFNALSEASSMSFTYPPTTKLSPLFTTAFVCNPST